MPLNVDTKGYPALWRSLSILITKLMTQKATCTVAVKMHNGIIKGIEVDRVYLTTEELTQFPPV